MKNDIVVIIGGEAGQGIQTVGDLLATVCWKMGLYITVVNDFESRIRGGHSFVQLRISDQPNSAPSDKVHILAALNSKTVELHKGDLSEGGLVLVDGEESTAAGVTAIPFSKIAREVGGKIMTNTVVAGAIMGLLGTPFDIFEELLVKKFGKKSPEILDNNITAAKRGFESIGENSFKNAFTWEKKTPVGLLLTGNKAVALGAVAGDCRFSAFYPMSPGTGIMNALVALTDDFPLVVEQVEDEIAAVNMILGAAYSGVRSMTATSGGGFSLMVEGLGLAGITETPILIVNAQRPGPATGLPTRTGQPDLQFTIHASQDEFPRFVFAPGTPAEAFDLTVKSLHLADKYQVPVVLLTDQYLTDSLFTLDRPLKVPDSIDRFIITDEDLDNPESYERYAFTESGVSPRVLPCNGNALCVASGNEHTPDGHLNEDADNRKRMMDKRNAKLPAMQKEMSAPSGYFEDSDILLVGWGSTQGAIREAVDLLRERGQEVGCLNFTDMWPFPVEHSQRLLGRTKRFIMVEQNSSSQLGLLIREQTGLSFDGTVLKYDGRPFFPIEIVEETLAIIG
ncbi:MAG: 2-oxoacid:acceptor oxidoreductase subunit alpha [Deltaproteobacteria bacterium]|nr:2-oxoacid:acceptor oxidoreductase subunit alpha [Deltaproteobacteria bacterium]